MSIDFLIKIKEKEKKINNNLVVWPSYNNIRRLDLHMTSNGVFR